MRKEEKKLQAVKSDKVKEHLYAAQAVDAAHKHGGIFGKNTELVFSLICGTFLGIGFGVSFVKDLPSWIILSCYGTAYFFGGLYIAKEAFESIIKGHFEIDF